MPATRWEPVETNWSDLAHEEIMVAFEGQLKSRAVALCVWLLAVNPEATAYEMETLARRDPDIETHADGTRVNAHAVRQARKIIEGKADPRPAAPRTKSTRKSTRRRKKVAASALAKLDADLIEKLQSSAEAIDEFVHISTELAMIQATFAKAHRALLEISLEDAIELADIEPSVAHVLAREGLLSPPSNGPSDNNYQN